MGAQEVRGVTMRASGCAHACLDSLGQWEATALLAFGCPHQNYVLCGFSSTYQPVILSKKSST